MLGDKRVHARADKIGTIVRSEGGAVAGAAALDALIP
jgi:hypothetical protein